MQSLINNNYSFKRISNAILFLIFNNTQRNFLQHTYNNALHYCRYSCVSRSCPDTVTAIRPRNTLHGSLPDHVGMAQVYGMEIATGRGKTTCPNTPPPSPSARERPQQNLVLVSTLIVDPSAPNFGSYYNSVSFYFLFLICVVFVFYFFLYLILDTGVLII